MKKLLLLLLPALVLGFAAHAADYDKYAYTPEQGAELISYVSPNDDSYVYNNLRHLTLMGIFRQERDFSLANYVPLADALKFIFRSTGLEDYAYACGENKLLRNELGIDPLLPYNPFDGFFIAAYQKGLISHQRLMGYFSNTPGCGLAHYAVRAEVIVWLAKLFNIPPSYDFTVLERYGDTSLIAPSHKPYFAGVINSGIGIVVNGSYQPCSLIRNGELVNLLTRFSTYLAYANGIESITAEITEVTIDEAGALTINTNSDITLKSTPHNTGLLSGADYIDNLYMLASARSVGKKITCHIKDGKVLFVSTNINYPSEKITETISASLYFYDNAVNTAVFKTETGYVQYFLSENATLLADGESLPLHKLSELIDRTFTLQLEGVNQYSMKKIVHFETGEEAK